MTAPAAAPATCRRRDAPRPRCRGSRVHGARGVGEHGDFHLHGFHDHQRVSLCDGLARRDLDLPHAAGDRRRDGDAILGQRAALRRAAALSAIGVSARPAARQRSRSASKALRCRWRNASIDSRSRVEEPAGTRRGRACDSSMRSWMPAVGKSVAQLQQLFARSPDRSGSGRRSAAATACRRGSPRSAGSDSTSARCGRRTDSRRGLPCRRRIDRRRRCPPRSPASRCAPGCTWW